MELLVIRHAAAEPRAADRDDADRALTEEGKRKFAAVVEGLRVLELQPERILHSPWRRAAETAEMLAPLGEEPPEALDELAAPPTPEMLGLLEGTCVAAVGHEPWVSELTTLLTVGVPAAGAALQFKKGGVAWLEGTPRAGGMMLRAFLPPRVLRAVSG